MVIFKAKDILGLFKYSFLLFSPNQSSFHLAKLKNSVYSLGRVSFMGAEVFLRGHVLCPQGLCKASPLRLTLIRLTAARCLRGLSQPLAHYSKHFSSITGMRGQLIPINIPKLL